MAQDQMEKIATQARQNYEKAGAFSQDGADAFMSSYSNAMMGARDYHAKLLEFAQANTEAAVDFFQRLSAVKSPSDFMELSTEHARQQLGTLSEQARELAALVQRITMASAEPVKQAVSTTFQPDA